MSQFEIRFSQWVLRNRILIIIASLLLVAIAGAGTQYLSFTTNYRVFFSKENPQLLAFDAMEKTYAQSDNVMFVIEPHDHRVFTHDTLKAVDELTRKAWQIPYSRRVDSLSNFQHTESGDDELIVRDLYRDPESLSNRDIEEIRRIALSEPLLVRSLVSESGRVTAVNVTVQLPRKNEARETPEVVDYARELKRDIENHYPVTIHLTGTR